ncbi:MAG: hypothetical protein KDB14_33665 [Planctomycetales bacterium]|nr:hypothetical protein [Planctomycetales bacterium]
MSQTPNDPYYKWLGIPPNKQPPNYYQLVGVAVREANPEVIVNSATRQIAHIREASSGSAAGRVLIQQIEVARDTLLNPPLRVAYDLHLSSSASFRQSLSELTQLSPTGPAETVYGQQRFFLAAGLGALATVGLMTLLGLFSSPTSRDNGGSGLTADRGLSVDAGRKAPERKPDPADAKSASPGNPVTPTQPTEAVAKVWPSASSPERNYWQGNEHGLLLSFLPVGNQKWVDLRWDGDLFVYFERARNDQYIELEGVWPNRVWVRLYSNRFEMRPHRDAAWRERDIRVLGWISHQGHAEKIELARQAHGAAVAAVVDKRTSANSEAKSRQQRLRSLQQDAQDPTEHEELGMLLLEDGDDQALAHLARSDHAPLALAANADLAGPGEPAAQLELADQYYALGQDRPEWRAALRRAKHWYELAAPQLPPRQARRAAALAQMATRSEPPDSVPNYEFELPEDAVNGEVLQQPQTTSSDSAPDSLANIRRITAHSNGTTNFLAASSDGRYLATVSATRDTVVWKMPEAELLVQVSVFPEDKERPTSVAFTADDQRLLIGGGQAYEVWLRDGSVHRSSQALHGRFPRAMCELHRFNWRFVLSPRGNVLEDIPSAQPLVTLPITTVSFSRPGLHITLDEELVCAWEGPQACVWNLPENRMVFRRPHPPSLRTVKESFNCGAISSDKSSLYIAQMRSAQSNILPTLEAWNLGARRLERKVVLREQWEWMAPVGPAAPGEPERLLVLTERGVMQLVHATDGVVLASSPKFDRVRGGGLRSWEVTMPKTLEWVALATSNGDIIVAEPLLDQE